MALAAGTPVGEYEVVRQLGAGAMGEVYEAVHPMIGKRVAIKVMRTPASEFMPWSLARFTNLSIGEAPSSRL